MKFAPGPSRVGHRVLRIAVTVCAIWWILSRIQVDQLGQMLTATEWPVFAVPIAGIAVNTALLSGRLAVLFRAMGVRVGGNRIVDILCRSAFAGMALPQGGVDIARGTLFAQTKAGLNRSIAALVALKLTHFPILAAVLLAGALSGVLQEDPLLFGAACVYAAIAAVVVVLAWRAPALPAWVPVRVSNALNAFAASARQLRDHPMALAASMLLAIPMVMVNCAVVWFLLDQFGHPMSFGVVVALVPAMDVLILLPISVAGIGVRESVFAIAFASRGVSMDTAIAIGMIRWTGELTRAGIGCMLWLLTAVGRPLIAPEAPPGGIENDGHGQ